MQFTDVQKAAFRSAYGPTLTEEQWNLFLSECERRELVPGLHVVAQVRSANEYSAALGRRVQVSKLALITTISALRLIADRAGRYRGHGPFKYYYYQNEDQKLNESIIPMGRIPHAVSVEGYRDGWKEPLFYTARYDAYVQLHSTDGGKQAPTRMWATRGEEQLAKCAEAGMLRTVAPEECGGMYISEEVENERVAVDEQVAAEVKAVVVPQATVAPAVNQAPATLHKAGSDTRPDPAPLLEKKPVEVVRTTPFPPEAGVAKQFETPTVDKHREPAVEQPNQESHQELQDFKDRVARDEGVPVQAAPKSPAPVNVAAANDEILPTPEQYRQLTNGRAAKIARDVLPKTGMKPVEAGNLLKEYLVKLSGKTDLKKIPLERFDTLLKALEACTPEQAAEMVRVSGKAK